MPDATQNGFHKPLEWYLIFRPRPKADPDYFGAPEDSIFTMLSKRKPVISPDKDAEKHRSCRSITRCLCAKTSLIKRPIQ
jgi:hypothetical protein